MISNVHWTILEDANHQLRLCLAKLRKTRATGDSDCIQDAEMDYFQALQHLYTSVQDVISHNIAGRVYERHKTARQPRDPACFGVLEQHV